MCVFKPTGVKKKLRQKTKKNRSHLRIKSAAPSISSTVLLVRDSCAPLQERMRTLLTSRRMMDLLEGGVAISIEGDGDTEQSGSGIKRADW